VSVDGRVTGAIDEPGLMVLVGVTHTDTPELAAKLAAKLWGLRILDGEKSCSDVGAPLLIISQFTLYADTRKGRQPGRPRPARWPNRWWTRWWRPCAGSARTWRPASSAPT
jgi:D-tyrosyl-tRNA(Tyr) deacylase